ncbi:hypothetical protein H9X90_05095 [Faecalicatena contorta]|uniref:hypothetical protein n=1 Tax=Faecalicatena contorta TaxID=39482 RepID=UPI00195F3E1D|nr:hypothetical protein [Faecalicatena contorta]MBM6686921.1 hypothetical protein [Faecalicatena contorta]MBM6710128.1 hypothetical protein [Faecalicatena contorta]
MAYKVIKASGSISGLTKREFIVDTAAEITDLPTNKKMGKKQTGDTVSDEMCAVGSTASVTETGDVYELNASSTWVKKPAEGSGEGSDITIDSTLTQEGQAADAKATGDALATKADASALSNYVQTSTAEGTYAKKTELSAYATTESLGNYMQTSAADAKYATKSELGSYATTESLGAYMQTTTADGKYATKSELSSYATTDSLDSYMQTTTADGKYATKSELGSYATTASLADYAKTSELPKGTAVTDATGETDAHTQLNALLASLRAAGIIASS